MSPKYTAEEMIDYIYSRVRDCESDMEEWGFDEADMDQWTQGNYEAYKHLLAKFI
jgi:hypothetical protein